MELAVFSGSQAVVANTVVGGKTADSRMSHPTMLREKSVEPLACKTIGKELECKDTGAVS